MWRIKSLLIAAPIAAGLLAAPAAHADWHRGGGGGGWHGNYGHYHGGGYWNHGGGIGLGGALLGLGAAAVIGGAIASQAYVPPPPVVYAAPRPTTLHRRATTLHRRALMRGRPPITRQVRAIIDRGRCEPRAVTPNSQSRRGAIPAPQSVLPGDHDLRCRAGNSLGHRTTPANRSVTMMVGVSSDPAPRISIIEMPGIRRN